MGSDLLQHTKYIFHVLMLDAVVVLLAVIVLHYEHIELGLTVYTLGFKISVADLIGCGSPTAILWY